MAFPGGNVTQVISVAGIGPPGPPGADGAQGPPGPPGTPGGIGYTHNQIAPSDTWVIIHNLGRYPSVAIVDSAGTTVWAVPHYDSDIQITITFSAAFAGKAYLN